MLPITGALSAATANIDGDDITADSVNRQTRNTDGLVDKVTILTNNVQTVSTSTSVTLTANQEVHLVMNNTSNATVALPAATSLKTIRIEKGANNFTTVTVNRDGSDTLSNPFGAVATPVGTSFVLYLPGEVYDFIPCGTYWRVVCVSCPTNQCTFVATRTSSNQSLTNSTFNKLQYNNEVEDIGGNYDNATNYNFTAPFNGYYTFTASAISNTGNTGQYLLSFYKNNAEYDRQNVHYPASQNADVAGATMVKLAATNTLDVRIFATGTQNLATGGGATFTGLLQSRY